VLYQWSAVFTSELDELAILKDYKMCLAVSKSSKFLSVYIQMYTTYLHNYVSKKCKKKPDSFLRIKRNPIMLPTCIYSLCRSVDHR
jgi:hypothetical protein